MSEDKKPPEPLKPGTRLPRPPPDPDAFLRHMISLDDPLQTPQDSFAHLRHLGVKRRVR